MQKGFWDTIRGPIVGLSPMDGVTDAPMRFITKKYGNPDVVYTEFVSAEGLWRIKKRGEMDHKVWGELKYDESDRPVIAQIFGSDPESFYEASKIVCELGFDGVDINMGCPSPGLEKRGGGAGLIRDKCNAVEVVEATRRGVDSYIKNQKIKNSKTQNIEIPVSLKTRIGSDKPDQKWWELLATMQMPAIAMHGRTFKQLYSGYADWELLFKAGEIIRESGAIFLGNGDIRRIERSENKFVVETSEGKKMDLTNKMDGVLVGRGAMGDPWIMRGDGYHPGLEEKLSVAVEHAKKFEEVFVGKVFFPMRKHLVGYANNFPLAGDLRRKLVMTNSSDEVERVCRDFIKENPR